MSNHHVEGEEILPLLNKCLDELESSCEEILKDKKEIGNEQFKWINDSYQKCQNIIRSAIVIMIHWCSEESYEKSREDWTMDMRLLKDHLTNFQKHLYLLINYSEEIHSIKFKNFNSKLNNIDSIIEGLISTVKSSIETSRQLKELELQKEVS